MWEGKIFSQNFTNGHLVVYLDGKVVFNATVGDDIFTVIFEIIDGLLGNHELKVKMRLIMIPKILAKISQ